MWLSLVGITNIYDKTVLYFVKSSCSFIIVIQFGKSYDLDANYVMLCWQK